MKFDKQELEKKIRDAKDLSNEDKSNLLQLLKEKKTYGLVWEKSTEDAWKMMKDYVPVLKEDESKRIDHGSENPNHILIEGDNLNALTALSYIHEGKIDVIYIDPPYNTGNKDFVYNDSFIGEDDAYRHSKWLSFMEKRLQIAKTLLSEKGVIFISIDDNEQANLKLLCDEVFGSNNFFTTFSWVNSVKDELQDDTKFAGANLGKLKKSFEYVLVYAKSEFSINADPPTSKYIDKLITNSANGKNKCIIPKGVHCVEPISKTIIGKVGGENDYYDIVSPEGMIIRNGVLQNDVEIYGPLRNAQTLDRFFKGETVIDHKGQQLIQVFLSKSGMLHTRKLRVGNTPSTVLVGKGTTKNGTLLLKNIFDGKKVFDFSKPVELISYLISKQKGNGFTILDFFAGSGTTLHATMQLNAEDGGHRQCILVTNNENNICEEVTYERNKRVIEGYTTPKGEFVEGLTKNNFRYYKVDFKERKQSHQSNRELFHEMKDLLCIKEDIYQEQHQFGSLPLKGKERMIRYFAENGREMLMVYDTRVIPFIVKEIEKMSEKEQPLKIYIFADGAYTYTDDFAIVIDKVSLVPMPYAYYRGIKDSLPDVEPKKEDNTELTDEEQKQMMAEAIEAENNEKEGGLRYDRTERLSEISC